MGNKEKRGNQCQSSLSWAPNPTDVDCSHEIKKHLLLGRRPMKNLDSVLKNRDITLPTKVHIIKAMVFPVVMYRCEKSEVKSLSRVQLFVTPWTVAYQAPQPVEFSRQEYWSGLSFPSPGDLPDPGIEPRSPALQADALPSQPPGKPRCENWII